VIAILSSAPDFIGVWLAVKAATRWGPLVDSHNDNRRGLGDDQVWLIGTALSVLVAYLGAWLTALHLPVLHVK
jgi:hypothetical protein